jgi:hypothetical protein
LNFTRHARECHEQAFDDWVHFLNETKPISTKTTNKITNHFVHTSRNSQHSAHRYSENNSRQIELSKSVFDNLIIKLGLPLSITFS